MLRAFLYNTAPICYPVYVLSQLQVTSETEKQYRGMVFFTIRNYFSNDTNARILCSSRDNALYSIFMFFKHHITA